MQGSGKAFIHNWMGHRSELNSTLAKRILRIRGIHDLETRQHDLRVLGSSCRWSTMKSRISGGREENIVVSAKPLDAGLHHRLDVVDATVRPRWNIRIPAAVPTLSLSRGRHYPLFFHCHCTSPCACPSHPGPPPIPPRSMQIHPPEGDSRNLAQRRYTLISPKRRPWCQ